MSGVQIMAPRQPNRKVFPFVGSCLFAGIPIDIEQRKGDVREGVDPDGHKWRVKMHAHYGEVRAKGWPGAKGMDGDQLDVYVGPDATSDVVVVIDQLVPATGKVDEQKVMLGFPTAKEAVACYKKQYDSPGFYGGHIVMTVGRFKQKLANKENAGSALTKALATIFKSGGPYIGPRGGKWADPQHTIPWKPSQVSLPMTRPKLPEWHERLLAVDASGRMMVDGFTDMKVDVTPANVHAIESRLRGQNIETAIVIGGGRTFARRGTSDSVPFMEHERMELAAYGDCVATHNHPHDAPLSPTDVVLAINANLSEMRAVTQHGVFWVRRPVEGWSILGAEYRVLNAMGRYLNEACDAASKVFRAKLGEERHHEVMQTGLSSVETDEFNQVFHQQSVRLLPELQSIAGRDVFGFTPWAEIETALLRKGEGNEGFERGSDDRRGDEAAAAGRGDSSGQELASSLRANGEPRAGCRDRHPSGMDGAVGEQRLVKAGGPYIGPHGGKWADPEHTVHWEPNTPHNFRGREPLGKVALKDGTKAILTPPVDGRDHITRPDEDAVVFGVRHEHDGRGLGYVLITRKRGSTEWRVGQASVVPEYRRNGLNSRLMDEASKWAHSRGESLFSGSLTSNEARAFYAEKLRQGRVVSVGGSYQWVERQAQADLIKARGGPYIGPRGGKWANAAHTIAWSERGGHRLNHRRGHDKLTPSHQKARARLAKHELRIRDSHVEHVIVAEGKGPLHMQEGEASHALMRRDDVERWARRGDAVLTHNHPSGMCFSESDMRTAYHANLAEIRAVTSSGVWSFVRPSDGWERPYHFIAHNNERLVVAPAQRAMQSHVRDHGFDQEVWLDLLVDATHAKLHPALIQEFGDDVSYTRWPDRPGKKRVRRVEKAKGGPYIGPRGGKWADPQHTIPWKPSPSAIHRIAGTVSGHGSEHEPLNWSASGIIVGELHPGKASLGDLAKAILEGDNDPERAELTYQWLRDSWPKLQKVRTSKDLFSALDGYDDHVNAVLREREDARELERADKRKAVVEASQAHRKLHDPGRVTTPEKGAAWASGGAMPAPLYHATLAGSSIMASGLKAREDLRRSDGSRVESLGGGPDNTVSTTPDPNGARKIAAVFAAIAEAEMDPDAVKSWLDKNWLPLVPPGYEAMLKEIEYADARPDAFLGVKARFNIISQIAGYAHPHVLVPAILAKPRVGDLGDIGVVTVYAHVDAVMDDRGRVSAGPGVEMTQGESHLRVVRPNDVGEVDHGDLLHRSHAHLKTAHIAIASDNKAEQGEVRVAPEDATSVGFEPVTDWRAILSGKKAGIAKSGSLAAAMGSLALLVPQDMSGVYNTIDDGWATRRYARMLTRRADLNYEAYRDSMGGLTRDGQPMATRLLDLPEQARDAWLRHSGDEPVFDANGVWIPLPDEEGELRWGEMAKGAHHKYIARFPTGNPKRPWRYVYRYVHRATRLTTFDGEGKSHSRAVHSATLHDKPSRLLDSNQPIVVGMSFSDGVIGKHSGHWVVSGISKNEDYPSLSGVVVKHDVTGEERFFHDRFDLGDFVDGLHTEGLAAESSRRAAVIARNQDEVFDQMVGLAKSNATKDELQQLSKASYRLARLGGDKPLALARYFKVSVEPPKGWAKARAELEQLRSDLSVFCLDGSVRDYEHAAALMFEPDALRKWIRFRVLQDWIDSHVDSLDAHDFLRRLMKEHQLTGDESSDAVEAAVKKTLMVMYKDGSTSMRPSDVKAMSGWDAASRMLGDRDGYGITDDGRVRRAKIKMALDDAFSARKIAAPTIRYGLPDRDEVVQKALKVGDRMTPSSWEPVTPEMLSDPPDNVQGLNPLTYMGSGVLMPFSVAIGRMADAPGRHEFLARHRESMDSVRSVVAEVHSVCAPLLEEHSARFTQDVYRDGNQLRVVVRNDKQASPAVVVLPLLSKALGIPEDAASRNANRLISHGERGPVTIQSPSGVVRGVTDGDRANAAPLFASVHPDVLPTVEVAHLPETGRSYCNHDTVVLHSNATRVTLWHEVGHAIEHLSPEISQAMRTYLLERSKGSPKTPLSRYGGYRDDEDTYPDQWSNPYCGKWYNELATEVLSMGLQNYLHDPVEFYRDDPEHFMLTAAAISGRFRKRDTDGPA